MPDVHCGILWGKDMNRQRLFVIIGIFIIAAVLAFPLRDAVYSMVIVPISYVLWVLNLVYHLVNQSVWWLVVIVLVIGIFARSLVKKEKIPIREPIKGRQVVGPVENLSVWMKKSRKGVYFRWLVANRLGRVAFQILQRRDSATQRSVFDKLTGNGWEPPVTVQDYLEAGLQSSFTDHSNEKVSPLDHNVAETLDYLEEQLDYH